LKDENPTVDWKSGEIQWKEWERQKLGQRAIKLTRARLAKQSVPTSTDERKKNPLATVEDAEEQEEDRTRNPLPSWYPSQMMIITAEEQKDFEDYAWSLLADPTSRIHQQHKELNINRNNFDIGQIEFDISQNEFDDDALLISYINGESSPELEDVWINSTMSHSQAFAQKYEGNLQDDQIDLKDTVPPQFHEYLDVFSDEKATRFLKSTPWDHKIKMKPGFELKSFKIYPMTQEKDAMTKEFIDENLAKGFIRPSKSPMATPFFFVHKKDHVRTTATLMTGRLKMCIHFHLFLTWWTRSRMWNTSQRWTYN
jgi:hypothetical protein